MIRAMLPLSIAALALAACDASVPPPTRDDAGVELRAFAENCGATEDCASGLCIEVSPGRGVCTRTCAADVDCPAGGSWGCIAPRAFGSQVCGCAADSDTERCGDGLDNDCNGRVDDCRLCSGLPVAEDDPRHCGACGNACRDDQECRGGACRCAIVGRSECGGRCVDSSSDERHCGACGNACGAAEVCDDGVCSCSGALPDACPAPAGGATCVDLGSDESSCGACGHRCPTGQICLGGACGCPDSFEVDHCGGVGCVDLSSDAAHCGGCENACRAGELCRDGECTCPSSGTTWCGGRCIDTSRDPSSCGACGRACRLGERCEGGTCICDSGRICGGACVARDDPAHCGACGDVCEFGQRCVGGSCTCGTGIVCGGACTDVSRDPTHCGACGNTCGLGQTCISGSCRCVDGRSIACGGTCVDPASDEANCGACGNVCAAGTECISSACRCPSGYTRCAERGGCVDLRNDAASCGSCTNVCAAGLVCSASRCACPVSGQSYCSATGVCEDLSADRENCGACGNVCAPSTVCSFGRCSCPVSGQTHCSALDLCADLRTNASHCGTCGNACPAGTTCTASACTCAVAGETLCGSTCAALGSSAAHCGTCGNACTGGRTCAAGACRCPPAVTAAPVRLTTLPLDDGHVELATNGTHVGVFWLHQHATGFERTYRFALLDLDGMRVIVDVPVALARSNGRFDHAVVWTGAEWGVAWIARIDGGFGHAYFQRITADGVPIGAAADVSAHWVEASAGALALTWSDATGYAVVTDGPTLQRLGLDGTARPPPVRPRVGPSTYGDVYAAAAPDGRVVMGAGGSVWSVNADSSITTATATIPAGYLHGVVWDGEQLALLTLETGQTIRLRRGGPGFATAHSIYTAPGEIAVRSPAIAIRGGSAVVVWIETTGGSSTGTIHATRIALPIGGAPFAVITPRATWLSDVSVSGTDALGIVVPTDSRAMIGWTDLRWGQTEVYAEPVDLGGCL